MAEYIIKQMIKRVKELSATEQADKEFKERS